MSLTKLVDGVEVTLSPEEEAAITAEWESEKVKKAAKAYKEKRKDAYDKQLGSNADQISAIYEYFSKNIDSLVDSEFKTNIQKWLTIKAEFPKPDKG